MATTATCLGQWEIDSFDINIGVANIHFDDGHAPFEPVGDVVAQGHTQEALEVG